jgi:hypothetical protein
MIMLLLILINAILNVCFKFTNGYTSECSIISFGDNL